MFGLSAGGHHLVNLLWHIANAVLLFLVLRQMTGSFWGAGFVAAVFAVHPLRAESVAWVSERKDVMSGFFFLMAIWVYVRYSRKPSKAGFAVLLLLFAAGLLANHGRNTAFCAVAAGLLAAGALSRRGAIQAPGEREDSLVCARGGGVRGSGLAPGFLITSSHKLSFGERAANAAVSYAVYVKQMFLPTGLVALYPIPATGQPMWKVGAALLCWRRLPRARSRGASASPGC